MGTFTVSFDCEGRWGFADFDFPLESGIRDDTLGAAYEALFKTLGRHEIRATFAVVGAFTLEPDQLLAHNLVADPPTSAHRNWSARFKHQHGAGEATGWSMPQLSNLVEDYGHELGTHGFSHLPFSTSHMTDGALDAELAMLSEWAESQHSDIVSMVYPRNQVGYVERLATLGLRCYRAQGRLQRRDIVHEVIEEINPFASSEQLPSTSSNAIVELPPGRFFKRRVGGYGKVPQPVTLRSWRSALRSAATKEAASVHLWLHPHNLLEHPSQIEMLDATFAEARRLMASGSLRNLTMGELAGTLAAGPQ